MIEYHDEDAPAESGGGTPPSRQVTWFETYSYAERLAASHGVGLDHLPFPGTPQWCGMPDDDARKLLALVLGGVREALTHDEHQAAMANASKTISAHPNWRTRPRGDAYIPRSREIA